jgi:signal transduction histidine kinase
VQARPDRVLDYREYPVLYVDDEPENLRIFELSFRREFKILTAGSAEEGLTIINGRPVSLVLSDHRMPGMTGVEFLAHVREIAPETVRILVTAYGDVNTLQSAINNGSIYRFVPKPWSPEEMRVTLRRGIEVYALDRERKQLVLELTLLNRIARSLNRELDLERLLDMLLTTVIEDLGYDAAGILFFDPPGEVLAWGRFAPASELSDSLRELKITQRSAPRFMQRLLSGEAQVLAVEQVLELERPIGEWVTEVAADQTLVIPLVGTNGVLGALTVDNRRGGRRFSGDDQTLLEGLSNQAATAIANAQLVEDLRRSREQILRADRLGTLGTLAAGLAHEINNPLVSIHTFLTMAPEKREQDDPEFWGHYHALACREVDRIRRLVDAMRRLGRGSGAGAATEHFDPGALAEEVVTLLQREAGRARVAVRLDREGGIPKIEGIKDHVQQVFINLVLNAIHASPEHAAVRVRVYPERGEEAVCVEVSDAGPGIPPEDLDRIFDPFFTTKGPDQGTGLGLMICHRIVARGADAVRAPLKRGASLSSLGAAPCDASPALPLPRGPSRARPIAACRPRRADRPRPGSRRRKRRATGRAGADRGSQLDERAPVPERRAGGDALGPARAVGRDRGDPRRLARRPDHPSRGRPGAGALRRRGLRALRVLHPVRAGRQPRPALRGAGRRRARRRAPRLHPVGDGGGDHSEAGRAGGEGRASRQGGRAAPRPRSGGGRVRGDRAGSRERRVLREPAPAGGRPRARGLQRAPAAADRGRLQRTRRKRDGIGGCAERRHARALESAAVRSRGPTRLRRGAV